MRFSTANDVRAIARELEATHGLVPLGMTYGDELEDPDVDYGFDVSLQVGETYVSVNSWDEAKGTMTHLPVSTSAEAADGLRAALLFARARAGAASKPSGS